MDLPNIADQPITWIVIIYIIVKEVLPKVAPDLVMAWSKKISTEERLFSLLESNNKVLGELKLAIEVLAVSVVSLDKRVDNVEQYIKDDGFAAFVTWFKSLPAYKELQEQEQIMYRGQSKTKKLSDP